MNHFRYRQFPPAIILWAVRWYCKYGISYRELEEMLEERGIQVDHTTMYRWVIAFAPLIMQELKKHWKPRTYKSWRVDETYIKVKGKWHYLYRAVDKEGKTVDFYLSKTRNTRDATKFLEKAVKCLKKCEKPLVIYTDKHKAYNGAIRKLRLNGKLPKEVKHKQVKYMNNIVEQDHGKLKRLIKPTLGFKTFDTAKSTLCGFELMRMFKKRQFKGVRSVQDEVRFISQALAC